MDEKMNQLTEIFQDVFDNEDITLTEDTKIKEITGWDSFIHISLMAAVQDEFGVAYNIEEIMKLKTVGELIASIEGKQ